jgi:hypothetical protein
MTDKRAVCSADARLMRPQRVYLTKREDFAAVNSAEMLVEIDALAVTD